MERALADVEIIQAAYPDEVTITTGTSFPLSFTIRWNEQDYITLELREGYPTDSGVEIASYRCNDKHRIETIVAAIRRTSQECQNEGIEGGLSCCSIALETWNEYDNDTGLPIKETHLPEPPLVVNEMKYNWISGTPLTVQKSTFQAHLCRVYSEQQVREALSQLITSSSKIQRATHNMVRKKWFDEITL